MTPEQMPIPEAFNEWIESQMATDSVQLKMRTAFPRTIWTAACIATFRHLSTTPSDTGARWVKASERLPEGKFILPIKIIDPETAPEYSVGYLTICGDFVDSKNGPTYPADRIEWLEEGPAPAPLQEKGIRFAEWASENNYSFRGDIWWVHLGMDKPGFPPRCTSTELYSLFLVEMSIKAYSYTISDKKEYVPLWFCHDQSTGKGKCNDQCEDCKNKWDGPKSSSIPSPLPTDIKNKII